MIIEDDDQDQHLLTEILDSLNLPNRVMFFADGSEALKYIEKTEIKPFLILSDIDMPKHDAYKMRKCIHNNAQLNIRCIPYLFFTTGRNRKEVYNAYATSAQGFFIKPDSSEDLRNTIRRIVEYWQECFSPTQYDED